MKIQRRTISVDNSDRDTLIKIQSIQDPELRRAYLNRLEDQKSASTNKLIAAGLLTAAAPATAIGAKKLGEKLIGMGKDGIAKNVTKAGAIAPLATAAAILGHDVLKKKNLTNEVNSELIAQQLPHDYSDEAEEKSPSQSREKVESVVTPEENQDDFDCFESLM